MPHCPHELPIYIDASMRSTWKSCQQKFRNAYIVRKVAGTSSIHLHAGKAFAKGCEVTRISRYLQNKPWDTAIFDGQRAIFDAWADTEEEVPTYGTGKTLPNMLLLLEEYFQTYDRSGSDLLPLIRDNGKPCVEFSFAIPIPGTSHPTTGEPILYVGRLDMLAKRLGEAGVWAVDEKTTSALGDKWGDQWRLRGQFIGYTFAARQYGFDCAGAVVRGVKITATGNTGFAEVPIPVTEVLIERWLAELRKDCEDIKAAWLADEWDYDFADACSAYGGCTYQMPCASRDPDRWIESNYVDNEWYPIDLNEVNGSATLADIIEAVPT